jgi:molecular chaperone GrpE
VDAGSLPALLGLLRAARAWQIPLYRFLFEVVYMNGEGVPDMPELEIGAPGADQGDTLDLTAGGAEPAGAWPEPGDDPGDTAIPGPGEAAAPALAELAADVSRLATAAEQYHERARQREGVIDYLRDEVDLLRRGERRSLLRPLLTALSRLHADLALQAQSLPPDFDAAKAGKLLESYAETVESVLADAGIITSVPEAGDPFDPRGHRKVGSEPTGDPARDGLVAAVRKAAYRDTESERLLAPAEVILYHTVKDGQ